MAKLLPFRLRPWFRTRVWGVRDLSPWYDYKVVGEPIGEVWLSGDDSVVDSGPLAGRKFADVFRDYAAELVGADDGHAERFPLLMKVLFPQEKLSVQVHPGDAMARKYGEPHGKTECWYVLEAEPGAAVALGLRRGTTLEQVRAAIAGNTLEDLLQWVPVEKGDMIFVDAGTIHAIGPGVVLLETQQNSDMTYRLYDYGRPRELHLERGLEAIRLKTNAGKVKPCIVTRDGREDHTTLIESNYFRVDRYRLPESDATRDFAPPRAATVQLIFVASGSGSLHAKDSEPIRLRRGELAVVPACVPEWSLTSAEPMEILRAVPR
ncbi:MAG: type I phosphomannose isomerase catalytic subunit [Acidobacteriaceae bacterium]